MKRTRYLLILIMVVLVFSCSDLTNNRDAVFIPEYKTLPAALPFKGKLNGKAEYAVKTPDEHITVSFEVMGNERLYEAYPAIIIEGSDSLKIIELKELLNYGWVLAGASKDLKHIWGLLDYTVEGPDECVKLIWSDDNGATWEYRGLIKKPDFMATAETLFLKSDGSGTLRMHLDEGADKPSGYYDYPFRENGRNWGQPEYIGNARKAGPVFE